tara:strand:- start:374 stop:676 length:303 start_codon:yes stop_codon:yes gene_type:complete
MVIKFKKLDDAFKTEIFIDNLYIGYVDYNIFSQRWTLTPSFVVPYTFKDAEEEKYASAYKAGKGLADLYNFLYPHNNEDAEIEHFGLNLDEILFYLKTRE